MEHKICMITGANSGIGKDTAIKMAQQGHQIILVCRSREKGEAAIRELKALTGNNLVELMVVDMALQSSIKDFANTFEGKYEHLDVLIHNAAIFDVTQKKSVYTAEGIESVWAKYHLGPVLLTK